MIDIQNTSEKVLGFFKTFIVAFKLGALFSFFIGGCLFLLLGKLYVDIRKVTTCLFDWCHNATSEDILIEKPGSQHDAVSVPIISLIIVSIIWHVDSHPTKNQWVGHRDYQQPV